MPKQATAASRASDPLLLELLNDREHVHPLDPFALSRSKDKRIAAQIREDLVSTFVTGTGRLCLIKMTEYLQVTLQGILETSSSARNGLSVFPANEEC